MSKQRKDHEPPRATGEWGWRFHHLGIPVKKKIKNETCIPELGIAVQGFDSSPFGIEWMRFEKECSIPALIRDVPHIAFEVDDLDAELARHRFRILTKPNSPSPGVRVAMIEHNGAPIELIEFRKTGEKNLLPQRRKDAKVIAHQPINSPVPKNNGSSIR
jgi:hypothetical protein